MGVQFLCSEDVKGVAEKIVAAKREIQTWGDQVPPELQTLLPEFETMVEAAILEGRDIEPLKELFEDPNLIASVKNFAPLANLADTDPELLKQQLKEGIAVSVAPNEQGEDVLHITVKGTGNVPAVTQMVDGINSLMKVAESVPEDAAKVMEMALVAAGGAASIVMEVTTEVAAQTEAGQTLLTKVNTGLETLGNVVGSVAAGSDTLDEFVQDVAAEKQHQDSDYYRSMQGGGNGVVVLVGMLAGVKKRDGKSNNSADKTGNGSEKNIGDTAGGADNEAGLDKNVLNPEVSTFNHNNVSTAKSDQSAVPRDSNEQDLWNKVIDNPSEGKSLPLNSDPRFPSSAGWEKKRATKVLANGKKITIHYQYNSYTGKAYDIKVKTPQRSIIDSAKQGEGQP